MKDQKITEFDITEKVAERLMGWAKILGALLGALAVVAGLLGVKTFFDIQANVEGAKKGIEEQKQEVGKLTTEGNKLEKEYAQLRSRLPEFERISKTASDLQEKMDSTLAKQNATIDKVQLEVQSLSWLVEAKLYLGVKDFAKALPLFQKAADAGNTDAMYGLGDVYKNASGVTQDYEKARYWYQKAADAGNPWGMYDLGDLYKNGWAVAQDYKKAREWFQKAIDAGNTDAMYGLGDLYKNSVPQDYEKARDWYQKAADAGNPWGMYDLGDLYKNGWGVAPDYQKAREWFQKAADLGNTEAKQALAGLPSK